MLERVPFGSPICQKTQPHGDGYVIVPGEFQLVRDKTIDEADQTTLITLDFGNYNIPKIECSVDCYREFFEKAWHFRKIGPNPDGTYNFVGLYYESIPVFIDVALNPETMVVYRERKNNSRK